MTKTSEYVSPAIISRAEMVMETSILVASIEHALNLGGVDTEGHEMKDYDFTNTEFFTHEWK